MPKRSGSAGSYRYGFQGQEKDDEIKGEGNSINYKFRMHDPRVGRFFAVDPLVEKFPWYSPYQFSGNKVIESIELEGGEEKIVTYYAESPSLGTSTSLILKHTDVFIAHHIVENKDGKQYAKTIVGLVVDGKRTDITHVFREEINPNGPTPSAAYDYTRPGNNQMVKDNLDFIVNGNKGGLRKYGNNWFERTMAISIRDDRAPDNAENLILFDEMSTLLSRKLIPKNTTFKNQPRLPIQEKAPDVGVVRKTAQVNSRHYLSSNQVAKGKTGASTVGPKEIIDRDLKAYNNGDFRKIEDNLVEMNGNIYGVKNEGLTLYPVKGESFVNLSQGQIKAIQLVKNVPADKLEIARKGAKISDEDLNFAKEFIKKY